MPMNAVKAKLVQNNLQWTLVLEGDINANISQSIWIIDIIAGLEMHGVQVLIIDLGGVQSIDSQGLKFLLDIHREIAGRDIQIILQNPSPHLRRLLRIMQFDRIFTIEMIDPS